MAIPDTLFDHISSDNLVNLLESILASVPDAMIVIDAKGQILAFSKTAEAIFGYTQKDVIGKNVKMLMTSIDHDHHDTYINNYLQTGQKQIIGIGRIVKARLASGKEISVELKIGEAEFDGDKIFTGYIRDVSEQEKSNFEISRMQDELNNFTRLSAVGTMASAMAHELNQPLTAVSNYLEASRDLLNSPDADTISMVQEALGEAAQQSIRAGQIIRKLRDYVSRGEVELRRVDICEVMKEAISLVKLGIEGKQVQITHECDENLPAVLADHVQIRQVIINLLKNAIEAVAKLDNPQVHIAALMENDDKVCISVIDNGAGILEGEQEELFTPFKSSKSLGMGLGLSICHTIVDAHDGKIWIDTDVKTGACFKFTLQQAIDND